MQSRNARPSLLRAGSSLSDIVLVIATALNKEGICAVLTGDGAAAMHISRNRQLARLHYTLTSPVAASRLASAVRHLGFELTGDGHYRHAGMDIVLELTQTPLAIGRNDKIAAQTLQLRHGFVRILSPSDCCREQLMAWRATRQGGAMQTAVDLAKHGEINMPDLRAWMRTEGFQGVWPGFKRSVEGTHEPFVLTRARVATRRH